MKATYHNATMCTFDGSECWVSVIRYKGSLLDTAEHDTQKQAVKWCRRELKARGYPRATIEDTTNNEALTSFKERNKNGNKLLLGF